MSSSHILKKWVKSSGVASDFQFLWKFFFLILLYYTRLFFLPHCVSHFRWSFPFSFPSSNFPVLPSKNLFLFSRLSEWSIDFFLKKKMVSPLLNLIILWRVSQFFSYHNIKTKHELYSCNEARRDVTLYLSYFSLITPLHICESLMHNHDAVILRKKSFHVKEKIAQPPQFRRKFNENYCPLL